MNCNEAAEFVSALCDGERIPPDAAVHVGECASCQERMQDYLAMGAEMRRVVSLEFEEETKPLAWETKRNSISTWWQKGWETMRIPRFAFAALVVALIAMGSNWTFNKVKAHDSGDVVLMHVAIGDEKNGNIFSCALSLVDKKQDKCFLGMMMDPSNKTASMVQFQILGRKDNGVRLGFKTLSAPIVQNPRGIKGFGAEFTTFEELDRQPQQLEVVFRPGEASKVEIPGYAGVTLHGEWSDHIPPPETMNSSNSQLDPGPSELRIQSPVLLRDNKVIGDWEGGGASVDKADQGLKFAMKDVGRFTFALQPLRGGIKGRIQGSRITFQHEGHSYTFLSGVYVARGEDIWIVYEPKYKLEGAGLVMNGSGSIRDLLVPVPTAN